MRRWSTIDSVRPVLVGDDIDLFLSIGPDVINSHVLSMSAMVADRHEKKGSSPRQLAPA